MGGVWLFDAGILGCVPKQRHFVRRRNLLSRLGHRFPGDRCVRNKELGSCARNRGTVFEIYSIYLACSYSLNFHAGCGAPITISPSKRCSVRSRFSAANPITRFTSASTFRTSKCASHPISPAMPKWFVAIARRLLRIVAGTAILSIAVHTFGRSKLSWALAMR